MGGNKAFPLIIDTDIGDDIDDAFAIRLALSCPEIDTAGITTVFRNSFRRAQIAAGLLELCGRSDIPVCCGADFPEKQRFIARPKDRYDENGFIPCQYGHEHEDIRIDRSVSAEDFIIEKSAEFEHELILVAMGPLTNIASALKKCPDIVRKIKAVYLMGGIHTEQIPEWNILCDPEAAQIVFASELTLYISGLNVTAGCKMAPQALDKLASGKDALSQYLSRLTARWQVHHPGKSPVLHDAVPVFSLIHEELVQYEKRLIWVELEGNLRGCTLSRKDFCDPELVKTQGKYISQSIRKNEFDRILNSKINETL